MKLLIFSDGAARSNPGPAAAAAILKNTRNEKVGEVTKFLGDMTNNQAEYWAIFLAIEKTVELGATELKIFADSKLAVEQLSKNWKIKNPDLKILAEKIWAELAKFENWEIQHVFREKNREADALANQILNQKGFPKSAFFG